MRNHCKAFRTAKTQTNTVNPITIELIQVFIITASCFKENHTCVDILGMLFVILHITFHHILQWNLIPGGKNQHSEKKWYYSILLCCNVILLALDRDNWSQSLHCQELYSHLLICKRFVHTNIFKFLYRLNNNISACKNMFRVSKLYIKILYHALLSLYFCLWTYFCQH